MFVFENAVTQPESESLAKLSFLFCDNNRRDGRKEFLGSWQQDIDALIQSCHLAAGNSGRVLDLVVGVGRLPIALRLYFGEVYGVDVRATISVVGGRLVRSYRDRFNHYSTTYVVTKGSSAFAEK